MHGDLQLLHQEETGSTNDDAKLLAEEGAAHMSAVCANRQTHARGRHYRNWQASEGNVHFSLIIRPQQGWPRLSDLVFVSALAVRKAVADSILSDPSPQLKLKWPNDVLLNDRKLAGILIETNGREAGTPDAFMIIGVGINVVDHPRDTNTQYPPTDLHDAGYHECTRDALIPILHRSFEREINNWLTHGFSNVRQRYLSHAHNLNQTIRVGTSRDKADYQQGIYQGIDEHGQLLLHLSDGTEKKLVTGDIIHHQP